MGDTPIISSPLAALWKIGIPKPEEGRGYLKTLGLGEEDVSALVELMKRWGDDKHFKATSPSPAMWAPIHAWRALGEMRALVVIPTFLDMLDELNRRGGDRYLEEFPRLCARIGAPAVELLVTYLLDSEHSEYARVAVAHGLQEIVIVDPNVEERACEALVSALGVLSGAHPDLNAFLIGYLADLVAFEHAELIERAFKAGVVSEFVCGDWSRIAFELGVGPAPPRQPSLLEELALEVSEARVAEAARPVRPSRSPTLDKAARKRQKRARKKSRGR